MGEMNYSQLSIGQLHVMALAGDSVALGVIVTRHRELTGLAREANRGGLEGAEALSRLTSWRLAQPLEPGEVR